MLYTVYSGECRVKGGKSGCYYTCTVVVHTCSIYHEETLQVYNGYSAGFRSSGSYDPPYLP